MRHVLLRQGVLGLKVKIMLPYDPSEKTGPKRPLPDVVCFERLPSNIQGYHCGAQGGGHSRAAHVCELVKAFYELNV